MEDRAERLTSSPFLIYCPTDGPQVVFEPFREWNDPAAVDSIGQIFSSIECSKCRNTLTVFEKITPPDNSFSLAIPKGWRFRFEEPKNEKSAGRLTVSSLGEPQDDVKNRAALLTVNLTQGENKNQTMFGDNFVKLEKVTDVSGIQVPSYKFETPEIGILTSRFALGGKTYKFRMDYNPELYISKDAEKDYQTILGSFSHRNSS